MHSFSRNFLVKNFLEPACAIVLNGRGSIFCNGSAFAGIADNLTSPRLVSTSTDFMYKT